MYNGKVIRELLKARGKKIKDLREAIGCVGNTSVLQIIDGNPTVSRLEVVADYFNVSMDVFFIRDFKSEKIDNVEFYEKLLMEKDARIDVLEKYVKLLEKEVHNNVPKDVAANK